MYLVIGGTGKTGKEVLKALVKKGRPCRALIRAKPGRKPPVDSPLVEYHMGDVQDAEALGRAMKGVEKVMVAMGNSVDQEQAEMDILEAALTADVSKIVKLSAPVVGPKAPVEIGRMHGRIEEAIARSGLAYTFLRPYGFMQNLLTLAPLIQNIDTFFGATGDAPLNFIDARDIADVAVAALTEPGHDGQAYVLTGPEALTYAEVATRMTAAFGRPIRYIDKPPAAYRADLERAQLPEWLVEHITEIQAMAVAIPERPNDNVARITGHIPRALNDFLKEYARAFSESVERVHG